jgi:hypothetical protein
VATEGARERHKRDDIPVRFRKAVPVKEVKRTDGQKENAEEVFSDRWV